MYVNHVCAVSVEARKKVLNVLELESWGAMYMLGTEPGFSAKAASTLNLSHLSGNQLKIFSLYVST